MGGSCKYPKSKEKNDYCICQIQKQKQSKWRRGGMPLYHLPFWGLGRVVELSCHPFQAPWRSSHCLENMAPTSRVPTVATLPSLLQPVLFTSQDALSPLTDFGGKLRQTLVSLVPSLVPRPGTTYWPKLDRMPI